MTAKELATELLEHPDYEVKFETPFYMYEGCDTYMIDEIKDIAHSDKVIVLGGDFEYHGT